MKHFLLQIDFFDRFRRLGHTMLSRNAKITFYQFAGPLMRLNGMFYRRFRAPAKGNIRVHLGPGQKNYIAGWINVDANAFTGKCDVWADLRNSLPFKDNSVEAFYSHHVIEHLPDVAAHFKEAHRCLKVGGIYRVAGPHGDSAIRKYLENDGAWFPDFPDSRHSIGGRFENFLLCRQEHVAILTRSFLIELLGDAGFSDIREGQPVQGSRCPEIFKDCLAFESESDFDVPHTIVMEAVKT